MTEPKVPVHQCANCAHFKLKMLAGGAEGKCYRYPPSAMLVTTPAGPLTATFWPGPKPTDWCSEWSKKCQTP